MCHLFPSAKIKNIIQTEDAKAKLLAEQRNKKKDLGTSFVPTNIAVNYVQHNRCEFSSTASCGCKRQALIQRDMHGLLTLFFFFLLVYHEDANAPQRHHRHKEEPKARPLRVGDTEKPGPEGLTQLSTIKSCTCYLFLKMLIKIILFLTRSSITTKPPQTSKQ